MPRPQAVSESEDRASRGHAPDLPSERGGRSDLEFVQAIPSRRGEAGPRLVRRLACVPRFLAARNSQLGAPLSDIDLEDVVQDVLVVIWSKLASFHGKVPLEVWVYRICCLELLNAIRKRRSGWRERRMPDQELEESSVLLEVEGEKSDRRQWLYGALDKLTDEERDIVRLKHFEDLSFTEIGRELGVSANTAKTRYYRGVQRLAVFLRTRGEDQP